jgi:hypothetical protein
LFVFLLSVPIWLGLFSILTWMYWWGYPGILVY